MALNTPTTGTIPALSEYQPGSLSIASTVFVEIVDSASATAATSWRMSQVDLVGKAPNITPQANPSSVDFIVFFQTSSGLPKSTNIGNLGVQVGNLPTGGATGTLLAKVSGTNFDTAWQGLSSFLSVGTSLALSGTTAVVVSVQNFGISSAQIATGAIGSAQIAAGAVGSAQIAPNSIGTAQIIAKSLGSAQIQTAGLTGAELANNTIGNAQLRQGSPLTVIGVAGNGTTNVADIAATGGTMVLQTNTAGSVVSFGRLTTAYLPVQFQVAAWSSYGVLISNATGAITATAPGTTSQVLMSNGTSSFPSFQQISLASTATVTGTLAVGNGGVGLAAYTAGDMLYASNATTLARFGAGTTGQLLQSNGSAVAPSWFSLTNGMVLLNTLTPNGVGSATDTTSFSSIYTNYLIEMSGIRPANITAAFAMAAMRSGQAFTAATSSLIKTSIAATTVFESDATGTTVMLSGGLATTSVASTNSVNLSGNITLYGLANTSDFKGYLGNTVYDTAPSTGTTVMAMGNSWGFIRMSNAVTGLAFFFQGTNIATGIIKIYGMV